MRSMLATDGIDDAFFIKSKLVVAFVELVYLCLGVEDVLQVLRLIISICAELCQSVYLGHRRGAVGHGEHAVVSQKALNDELAHGLRLHQLIVELGEGCPL